MPAIFGKYKGRPTISLHDGSEGSQRFPFTFGFNKAKLIVDNFEAIQTFVRKNLDQLDTNTSGMEFEDLKGESNG